MPREDVIQELVPPYQQMSGDALPAPWPVMKGEELGNKDLNLD
jgi:hypothetical protein